MKYLKLNCALHASVILYFINKGIRRCFRGSRKNLIEMYYEKRTWQIYRERHRRRMYITLRKVIFEESFRKDRRAQLTSWYNMIDTRFKLYALIVSTPAKESAIVQFGHWRIGGNRVCTVACDVCLRYVHRFHCIIEFPGERYFRWVRLQLAGDPWCLLSRYTEYLRLTVLAYRNDWKCKC